MIKEFVDILSFNNSQEGSIIPSKGEKSMGINISAPRKIEGSTSQLNEIISTLVGSREIKFSGKVIPTDELVVFHNIHNTLDAFISPHSGRTTLSQGQGFTLVKKIPPYGAFAMQGIIVIKRGIINIAPNIFPGFPNGSENPSSPNCYGELASN
jgi:hypothetical protein